MVVHRVQQNKNKIEKAESSLRMENLTSFETSYIGVNSGNLGKKSSSNNFHSILIILNIFKRHMTSSDAGFFSHVFDIIRRVYQINWLPDMK